MLSYNASIDKDELILQEIESKGEKQFLPIIGREKGQVLVNVIHDVKPKRVLEVGTLIGYSAVLIGRELSSDDELITIDIHDDEAELAKRNIERADLSVKVMVLTGDAVVVIPSLAGFFDLVFLDAEKSEYLEYLRLVEDKLHAGSVVVADNAGIFAEQMSDFLSYVRNSGRYRSRYYSFGKDGVEVSIKL